MSINRIDAGTARHIANFLYCVDAYLPIGEHIHTHLQFALFRFSEGKEPKEIAKEIEASLTEQKS